MCGLVLVLVFFRILGKYIDMICSQEFFSLALPALEGIRERLVDPEQDSAWEQDPLGTENGGYAL